MFGAGRWYSDPSRIRLLKQSLRHVKITLKFKFNTYMLPLLTVWRRVSGTLHMHIWKPRSLKAEKRIADCAHWSWNSNSLVAPSGLIHLLWHKLSRATSSNSQRQIENHQIPATTPMLPVLSNQTAMWHFLNYHLQYFWALNRNKNHWGWSASPSTQTVLIWNWVNSYVEESKQAQTA